MTTWFAPTVRAMDWRGLLAAVPLALVLSWALAQADGGSPGFVVSVVVASTAGAAVLAVHDAARSLVCAVPTPAWERLARRLLIVLPLLATAVSIEMAAIERWYGDGPSSAEAVRSALALLATGVAVLVVSHRKARWPVAEVAAGAPFVWVLAESWVGTPRGIDILTWWHEHPLWILAAALAVTVAALAGPEA